MLTNLNFQFFLAPFLLQFTRKPYKNAGKMLFHTKKQCKIYGFNAFLVVLGCWTTTTSYTCAPSSYTCVVWNLFLRIFVPPPPTPAFCFARNLGCNYTCSRGRNLIWGYRLRYSSKMMSKLLLSREETNRKWGVSPKTFFKNEVQATLKPRGKNWKWGNFP